MKKDRVRKSYYIEKGLAAFIGKEAKEQHRSDSNALEMILREIQAIRHQQSLKS